MKKLAQAIFGSQSSVELVLGKSSDLAKCMVTSRDETGIRPSGASSILVPASECIRKDVFSYVRPQDASDFLSLSPLQYSDAAQLLKRLNALKPKGKRKGEDDSAANKMFFGNTGEAGLVRSAFEHNRYHVILCPCLA